MRPLDTFLSPTEQRLMGAVLAHPDRDYGTLELLGLIGNSRGAGSAVIKRWVASGLIRERHVGNQRRLSANPDFLLYPELRRMVFKTIGLVQPLVDALAPISTRIHEAFVFGSIASGTDTSHSDIDLAVIGDVDPFLVSPLLDAAQLELGRSIHASIYSEKEWTVTKDPVVKAIKNGPRLDLTGALRDKAT